MYSKYFRAVGCSAGRSAGRAAALTGCLVVAILCAPLAHAGGDWRQKSSPASTAVAAQAQGQIQTQGQTQGQIASGGSASALTGPVTASGGQGGSALATGGSASNAGNTQASYTEYAPQNPPAFSGSVQPTISCADARNGGAATPFAGISFGFSTHDKECDLREDARLLYAFGQPRLAVELICKDAAKFGLKHCAYTPPAPAVTVVRPPAVSVAPSTAAAPSTAPTPAQYVTHAELRRAERRMMSAALGK